MSCSDELKEQMLLELMAWIAAWRPRLCQTCCADVLLHAFAMDTADAVGPGAFDLAGQASGRLEQLVRRRLEITNAARPQ